MNGVYEYWPGFHTRMLVTPELAYAVTFITNCSDDIHTDRTAFEIAEAYSSELFKGKAVAPGVTPAAIIRPPTAIAFKPAAPQERTALTGTYYSSELNKAFRILSAKNKLILQIDEGKLELKQTGAGIYTFQDAMVVKFSGKSFRLDVGDELRGLVFVKIKCPDRVRPRL